jgi:integration host factor subunit alpha|tara:strand:+ start:162 stop:455 length:294 start_codon:yes stop_codon:yes gene_type:complete
MAETLTKAKLATLLHQRVGVTKKEASDLVDEVFGLMRDQLSSGDKVKISGFGNFLVRDKAARRGRNPQTNEEIIIARRRVLTFRPSQVLRTALNDEQ